MILAGRLQLSVIDARIEIAGVALAGLSRGNMPWCGAMGVVDPRRAIEWARSPGLPGVGGFRGVQLDATLAGMRPRELDRSGRRDLAALLRRADLALTGVDALVPPSHLIDPANVARAVEAIEQAVVLAAELATLAGSSNMPSTAAAPGVSSDGPVAPRVVCVELPDKLDGGVLARLESVAERAGVAIADCSFPARAAGLVRAGVDPASILLGGQGLLAAIAGLRPPPSAARLDDIASGGRVPVGDGKLDVIEYQAGLHACGYRGPIVLDLRGLRDQEAGARAALLL